MASLCYHRADKLPVTLKLPQEVLVRSNHYGSPADTLSSPSQHCYYPNETVKGIETSQKGTVYEPIVYTLAGNSFSYIEYLQDCYLPYLLWAASPSYVSVYQKAGVP